MTDRQSKKTTNLRKEISIATGVGETTIAHVVAKFNKTGKVTASEQGHRAPKDFQAEYMNAIHDLILSANRDSLPLSLREIILELSKLGFGQKQPDILSLWNALLSSFQEEITPDMVVSCWRKCLEDESLNEEA
ncbi:9261_t:CDS:2 [Cetraspora pellucida]|uniref:9261_t:CDS:1 n=1 Tax=Cetraspora pellucida TaxID=1433469 RepID=A0A9N9F816_9GLOM|nr:9261_t:CDS:2 [Cetraspora pellucida]